MKYDPRRQEATPGAAPSSMTCSLEVRVPFTKVFCAKLITVLAASDPGACAQSAQRQPQGQHRMHACPPTQVVCFVHDAAPDKRQPEISRAFRVEKAAACASRAWLRFCSTENSCMKPFTSCGLQHRIRDQIPAAAMRMPGCVVLQRGCPCTQAACAEK